MPVMMTDSVTSFRLKEGSVKSEAVADANKLTLTVFKNPHFTKKVIYWRQWTLGVVK